MRLSRVPRWRIAKSYVGQKVRSHYDDMDSGIRFPVSPTCRKLNMACDAAMNLLSKRKSYPSSSIEEIAISMEFSDHVE